jgi:uncharacterized protein YcbX
VRLESLHVHPVKSTAARSVASAKVERRGLVDDRSWVVVDADGVVVTAREARALLAVRADTPSTDPDVRTALRLRHDSLDDVELAEPDGPLVRVRLFRTELQGVPAGAAADAWVGKALARDDVRLVWCDDPTRRVLNPEYSRPGDHTAYADGYPVTIASRASLRRLDDLIVQEALSRGEEPPAPLPMHRFRPNLVVEGAEAFAEDGWREVRVGEVSFRVAKPVDRCVITTIDTATLHTSREPVRTLARHRLVDGKPMFAVHLVPTSTGTISIGDEVVVTG